MLERNHAAIVIMLIMWHSSVEQYVLRFQHGKRMGQPVPSGRRSESRGRRDRIADQRRQTNHTDAAARRRAAASCVRRKGGEDTSE